MIPADYVCECCGAEGVKLWRGHAELRVQLRCAACASAEQNRPIDLSQTDQIGWCVPAVPNLRGGWWGYGVVPAEGREWWVALPLALTGEWKVRGGVMRWMSYREAVGREHAGNLRRLDLHREGSAVALVFVPSVDAR